MNKLGVSSYLRGLVGLASLLCLPGCGRVLVVADGGVAGEDAGSDGGSTSTVRGPTHKPADAAADAVAIEAAGERDCTPGDRICDGTTPLACDASGTWQRGTACAHMCQGGGCVGVCTPGDRACTGNIPQTCSGDGLWQTGAACPFVCSQGACAGVCLPGARQCDPSGLPQTCDAAGVWQSGAACPFVCSQGLCTGLCKPGDRGCNGAVPETCGPTGQWQLGNACPFVCSQGQCAGSCVPGAHQCAKAVPQTCGAGGQWQDGAACPFVCAAGVCGGTCVPDARRCQNGEIQACDATGGWQTVGSAQSQLLSNPAFDLGPGGWGESSAFGEIITLDDGTLETAAHTGSYLAWLGGYDDADDELYQSVAVPAAASAATLTFYYKVFTEERASGSEFDTLDVVVTSPDGTQVRLGHFSDNSATSAWTRFTASLPAAVAGRTVEIRFVATTDSSLLTSFYIDSVSLDVTACPALTF